MIQSAQITCLVAVLMVDETIRGWGVAFPWAGGRYMQFDINYIKWDNERDFSLFYWSHWWQCKLSLSTIKKNWMCDLSNRTSWIHVTSLATLPSVTWWHIQLVACYAKVLKMNWCYLWQLRRLLNKRWRTSISENTLKCSAKTCISQCQPRQERQHIFFIVGNGTISATTLLF